MGFDNPRIPWREFERRLSWGSPPPVERPAAPAERPARPVRLPPRAGGWAELHCHSSYSFLDGASSPAELVEEAVRLGVEALAITDHDGMYGAVRLKEAAKGTGVGTIFGAELSLDLPAAAPGEPDPGGRHLLVLARDVEGYARLSAAISRAQLAGGEKGRPVYDLTELAASHGGHWVILTGCRKGAVHAGENPEGELRALIELFGRENVFAELIDHDQPLDDARDDALYDLARRAGIGVVASNNVHYAAPRDAPLAQALAAVRARRGLDDMESWLPATGTAHLRSSEEMAARLARFPGVLERTVELARSCVFDLDLVAPNLPDWLVPPGHTEATWLRHLVAEGARERYGTRRQAPKAYRQIARELNVIEQLGFPGYFLIVHEIVEFCRDNDILCQGRGSAANSAVCYALGITGVDAVKHNLLFERFLSPGRDGPPDIDLDIENRRREEVIQHVYEKYGRDRAAQVANVITYRPRMAVRDAARALGFSPGQQDAWSRQLSPLYFTPVATPRRPPEPLPPDGIPEAVTALADRMQRLPRHLGIHSGGMVICDRPIGEVCPVEWARMPGRSVLQWDKDDCAAVGLVKFDLLGLGMLAALHDTFDLVGEFHGRRYDLHTIPPDDLDVYAMLCDADTVGVFQVESRAQMATLPRLKPKTFYDLVVEVALIRPGPIQGGSVHPYLRRRNGQEPPDIPHPLMRNALERTMGVPLFQEQMMQLAVDCAGFTPAESDALRQAMSAKRAPERVERLRDRLLSGMAERGIPAGIAEEVYEKILGFASFGFPESHAQSFAHLVYASAYLKRHYPAAFTAGLLRNQPMGFYNPQTLLGDARRHGVRILGVDVNASSDQATLEGPYTPAGDLPHAPGEPQPAIRLGLSAVRNLGEDAAKRIAAGRPYADLEDLVRRVPLSTAALEALATAGAFGCFGLGRREALWAAGALSHTRPDHLPGTAPGTAAPELPAMTVIEQTIADLWATGTSQHHPIAHVRAALDERGALPLAAVKGVPGDTNILVAGVVTHRQRPGTANGVIFFNLEDETGMLNVLCRPQIWERFRNIAFQAQALLIHGRLERHDGAANLIATRLQRLPVATTTRSRDFR
ncbi:error-prone DNA polymerase [Actinoallomurus purpureus]|uniref:error-prone DNA polymerase n=1 Tax=Actinoallomurus purpureus TaxID=478114 RepID=UPI002093CBAB|nr:error-prone DNA polymerase [Actinoallomurus purpureus]MCO6005176.1 error-prone DNA polymerase [Actinoallomurus purpureus]